MPQVKSCQVSGFFCYFWEYSYITRGLFCIFGGGGGGRGRFLNYLGWKKLVFF
jgi:hypothetical protein